VSVPAAETSGCFTYTFNLYLSEWINPLVSMRCDADEFMAWLVGEGDSDQVVSYLVPTSDCHCCFNQSEVDLESC